MVSSGRPLSELRVIQNCPADWSKMHGDDQSRFCGQCQKNVYNLSNMTSAEAEELIRRKEGRLCVRYYMRPDGKVMTSDCPKSIKVRVKLRAAFAGLFAVFGLAGCTVTGDVASTPQEMLDDAVASYPNLKRDADRAPKGAAGHNARQALADCRKDIYDLQKEIRSGK